MRFRFAALTALPALFAPAAADTYRVLQVDPGSSQPAYLGRVAGYQTAESAQDYYDFTGSNPDLPPDAPTLVSNRSHVFIIESSSSGVCLVFIHDRRNDDLGGRAQTRWTFAADPNGAAWLVQDGPPPNDDYTGGPGGSTFAADHEWPAINSDGGVIGSLEGCWTAIGSFADFDANPGNEIVGLDSWAAYSPGDITVTLALELDRPIWIAPTANPDVNADGLLDFFDVLNFLQAFSNGSGLADFVPDGTLDFFDVLEFLSAFSAGCP